VRTERAGGIMSDRRRIASKALSKSLSMWRDLKDEHRKVFENYVNLGFRMSPEKSTTRQQFKLILDQIEYENIHSTRV